LPNAIVSNDRKVAAISIAQTHVMRLRQIMAMKQLS
jgi:hypothetical protein